MARTCTSGSDANAHPSCAEKVDLPTPPLPERTRILRFTWVIRSRTNGNAVSGPLAAAPDAHTSWFGQPSHAADLPASSDSVPWGEWSMSKARQSGTAQNDETSPHRTVFWRILWNRSRVWNGCWWLLYGQHLTLQCRVLDDR